MAKLISYFALAIGPCVYGVDASDDAQPAYWKSPAAFSPNSQVVAVLDWKRRVHIWDASTGKKTKEITLALEKDELPIEIHFTPISEIALLVNHYPRGDRPVLTFVLDLTSGKRSPAVRMGSRLAMSPNCKLVAGVTGLWDIATGNKICEFPASRSLALEIVFSPDGKTVLHRVSESLAQDYSMFHLFDRTGKKFLEIGTIDIENGIVLTCPRFSADGKKLAFLQFEDDTLLNVWDLDRDRSIQKIKLSKRGHRVAGFSPDGQTLVSWNSRGGITLWDLAMGKQRRLIESTAGADSILISPDGNKVAVIKGKNVEFRVFGK
jgi:WD40 repeat protein